MPMFSAESTSRLQTCHAELQLLFFEVIRSFDCVVLEGYRNEADQEAAFLRGNTKLHYPNGNHNHKPSLAVDVAPYKKLVGVDWKDTMRFHYFAGVVMGIAATLHGQGKMLYRLRWGGDWNMDTEVTDETFRDLVHFELRV